MVSDPSCWPGVCPGVYPPQLRVFELEQLALKFERNLQAEVVDFQVGAGGGGAGVRL